MSKTTSHGSQSRSRDLLVAGSCGVFVALMVGMAYAAVPLYDWFCRTTGFAGTTQVATSAPSQTLERTVTVRFDTNVSGGLPWKFEPEQRSVDVRLGEVLTVNYTVINQSARTTVGTAGYNVTPLNTGVYFQKINCFCFSEQRLKAGERRELTLVFYVDPALANDRDADGLNTITLSYTAHPLREAPAPVAETKPATSGRS